MKTGKKGGFGKFAAPAAGAVIGAAIGGTAGAILTNEKTKKSVADAVGTASEYAKDAIDSVKENRETLEKVASDIASGIPKKTKK